KKRIKISPAKELRGVGLGIRSAQNTHRAKGCGGNDRSDGRNEQATPGRNTESELVRSLCHRLHDHAHNDRGEGCIRKARWRRAMHSTSKGLGKHHTAEFC